MLWGRVGDQGTDRASSGEAEQENMRRWSGECTHGEWPSGSSGRVGAVVCQAKSLCCAVNFSPLTGVRRVDRVESGADQRLRICARWGQPGDDWNRVPSILCQVCSVQFQSIVARSKAPSGRGSQVQQPGAGQQVRRSKSPPRVRDMRPVVGPVIQAMSATRLASS